MLMFDVSRGSGRICALEVVEHQYPSSSSSGCALSEILKTDIIFVRMSFESIQGGAADSEKVD